jgi:hypothetical protein
MRTWMAVIALSAIGFAAPAQTACRSSWVPTQAMVRQLEARLVLPRGTGKVQNYDRSYTGACDKGRRMIVGLMTATSGRGTSQVVARDRFPMVMDGGCAYLDVYADMNSRTMIVAQCHGDA